jgi:hypothetical protein
MAKEFIQSDAKLSQHWWLKGEPFYVGTWDGYVAECKKQRVVHLSGFGRDVSHLTFVVYRMAFTAAGGGREDFITIDPDTRKVTHIRGLAGR